MKNNNFEFSQIVFLMAESCLKRIQVVYDLKWSWYIFQVSLKFRFVSLVSDRVDVYFPLFYSYFKCVSVCVCLSNLPCF